MPVIHYILPLSQVLCKYICIFSIQLYIERKLCTNLYINLLFQIHTHYYYLLLSPYLNVSVLMSDMYVCMYSMYVCMYVLYICMRVCTKSFLKTTTNSLCVCAHLANKADSDSGSDSDQFVHLRCLALTWPGIPQSGAT